MPKRNRSGSLSRLLVADLDDFNLLRQKTNNDDDVNHLELVDLDSYPSSGEGSQNFII